MVGDSLYPFRGGQVCQRDPGNPGVTWEAEKRRQLVPHGESGLALRAEKDRPLGVGSASDLCHLEKIAKCVIGGKDREQGLGRSEPRLAGHGAGVRDLGTGKAIS